MQRDIFYFKMKLNPLHMFSIFVLAILFPAFGILSAAILDYLPINLFQIKHFKVLRCGNMT